MASRTIGVRRISRRRRQTSDAVYWPSTRPVHSDTLVLAIASIIVVRCILLRLRLTLTTYLRMLVQQYQPTRSLRSASHNLLALPTLSSEFDRQAVSYCTLSVWNKLLLSIRCLNSFNSFKSYLKTHLFAHRSYPLSSRHLATARVSDSSLAL